MNGRCARHHERTFRFSPARARRGAAFFRRYRSPELDLADRPIRLTAASPAVVHRHVGPTCHRATSASSASHKLRFCARPHRQPFIGTRGRYGHARFGLHQTAREYQTGLGGNGRIDAHNKPARSNHQENLRRYLARSAPQQCHKPALLASQKPFPLLSAPERNYQRRRCVLVARLKRVKKPASACERALSSGRVKHRILP